MRNRSRQTKEHKSIIVRTKKGNTVDVFSFVTTGKFSDNLPSACNKLASFDKVADRVEINWNVGGDVFITLYNPHPNGFEIKETIVFDKEYVTEITIETDFIRLRKE